MSNFKGWRKIRTKYCQAVSITNRIERYIFASLCIELELDFSNTIFIDESTIQSTCNASRIWFKHFENETRLGMIGKYKHLYSVHVLGGISRKVNKLLHTKMK